MNRENKITDAGEKLSDDEFDITLRPKVFDEFTGQNKIVSNLKIFIQAAKQRGESLDHVLLTGPPGLGKTTLSYIMMTVILWKGSLKKFLITMVM